MTNEKKKTHSEQKNCVTPETPDKTCDTRCKICNSSHLKAIFNLRKAGNTFLTLQTRGRIENLASKKILFRPHKIKLVSTGGAS